MPTTTSRISRRSFLARTAQTLGALALARAGLPALAQSGKSPLPSTMELAVAFSIVQATAGRYNRPYVAVWLEDAAGTPVRTVALWIEASGRGLRYLRDLTRWYGDNGGGDSLIDTVSAPTRNPGSYTLTWDGKTDKGAQAPQGDYYFCLESAREHGPYSLIREKITLGASGFSKKYAGSNDVGGVTLDYRKRA